MGCSKMTWGGVFERLARFAPRQNSLAYKQHHPVVLEQIRQHLVADRQHLVRLQVFRYGLSDAARTLAVALPPRSVADVQCLPNGRKIQVVRHDAGEGRENVALRADVVDEGELDELCIPVEFDEES